MGRIVISAFKPKEGKAEELKKIVLEHLPVLKSQNLVTERSSIIMEAKDGTIIEVFEWISEEAVEVAHTNPEVMKIWDRFAEVCDYVPINSVEEAGFPFSHFSPVN